MIVRELVASFGIDFDETGAKRAERSLQNLDRAFSAIGLGLSFAGVYQGLRGLIGLSSGAEEEANVLKQTFGEFAGEVVNWANVNAQAMSRSSVDMQKYAGQLGAVLAPMLENKKAAADMAESLAGLSVDLASFFNLSSDQEAMERLRSGILGSTEAVDQLGINLRAEHIEAVMAEQGLKKHFKTLSEGEKVQMRFLTIMKDTIDKQGDAARTQGSYANRTKAAEANVKDLGRAIGERLMPVAKTGVDVFADFSAGLVDVVNESHAVETSMVVLSSAASLLGLEFVGANYKSLLAAGGLGLFALTVEDVYTSLEGGEGYFKDFFVWAKGEDSWKEVMEYWKLSTKGLGDLVYDLTHPEVNQIRNAQYKGVTNTRGTLAGKLLNETVGVPYAEDAAAQPKMQQHKVERGTVRGWLAHKTWGIPYQDEADARPLMASPYGAPPSLPALPSDAAQSSQLPPSQWFDFAKSVEGLLGAAGSLPANSAGVPMSVPVAGDSVTNVDNRRSGDVTINVSGGANVDVVREARRVARELIDDNNRSLIDSASSR